jgi:hypothetical protein
VSDVVEDCAIGGRGGLQSHTFHFLKIHVTGTEICEVGATRTTSAKFLFLLVECRTKMAVA